MLLASHKASGRSCGPLLASHQTLNAANRDGRCFDPVAARTCATRCAVEDGVKSAWQTEIGASSSTPLLRRTWTAIGIPITSAAPISFLTAAAQRLAKLRRYGRSLSPSGSEAEKGTAPKPWLAM